MVGQKRRKSRKSSLMGNHQRCWLWGRHAVLETLRADRWPIVELRMSDSLSEEDQQTVTGLAEENEIPITVEPASRLVQLCGASDHQGLLAKMPPFPYASLADVMSVGTDRPALVLLDRIQDPHNFGAIIRAADVLGMDGLIVGTKEQSEVTSVVARSSAGAVNHLSIAKVPDLAAAVHECRRSGFTVVAADAGAATDLAQQDLTGPTLLVLGNEHAGVSDSLLALSHATVKIPQAGQIESLNVAVAAGILFYELRRQRANLPSHD